MKAETIKQMIWGEYFDHGWEKDLDDTVNDIYDEVFMPMLKRFAEDIMKYCEKYFITMPDGNGFYTAEMCDIIGHIYKLLEEYEEQEQKIKQLEFDVQTASNNFDRIKSKRIEKLEQLRENILKSECGGLWVTIKDIDEMIERIARNLE